MSRASCKDLFEGPSYFLPDMSNVAMGRTQLLEACGKSVEEVDQRVLSELTAQILDKKLF